MRHLHRAAYRSADPLTGANTGFINPAIGLTWGAQDPARVDNGLGFGGASWRISPSLADIPATQAEAKARGKKVVLSIYFRQPYVLDEGARGCFAAATGAHRTFQAKRNEIVPNGP